MSFRQYSEDYSWQDAFKRAQLDDIQEVAFANHIDNMHREKALDCLTMYLEKCHRKEIKKEGEAEKPTLQGKELLDDIMRDLLGRKEQ